MAVHSPPSPRPPGERLPEPLRRGPRERLAAWLVTGPIGHLYSGVADLAVFAARLLARRLAGRS